MQHPTKFRKISTTKRQGCNGTVVTIFDADTGNAIFEVAKEKHWQKEFEILNGRRSCFQVGFTNGGFGHEETIVKLCGEPKNAHGHGSKSLNPNFNQWQELSLKGFVKVAEHFAQFETTTFEENTRLAELERKVQQ